MKHERRGSCIVLTEAEEGGGSEEDRGGKLGLVGVDEAVHFCK